LVATLYLVSTPIGNLGDLSARAEEVLRSVDRILAEDTRRTRPLAVRIGAEARLVSLHQHNERQRVDSVLEWLSSGENLALVSDAGTPLVSDPGASLVKRVASAGHDVIPIPGPSAVLAALVGSGLPTERFAFLGFPEKKGGARKALLERVRTSEETILLFESPQRTVRLLQDLVDVCGAEREVAVARELTKIHEEFQRGTMGEVLVYYQENEPRGEVTVVVSPSGEEESEEALAQLHERGVSLAQELLAEGVKPSAAAKELSARLDLSRNDAYRIVQSLREDTENV
jgi:16S rRNA (cytidine1402-2'-O)-methyltransferase